MSSSFSICFLYLRSPYNLQEKTWSIDAISCTSSSCGDSSSLFTIMIVVLNFIQNLSNQSYPNRTPTDRRYYTYDQYLQFKGINTENDDRQVVIYARVSTRDQKDDLQDQVSFLRQFCNARGMIVDQCIEEYGSGLNRSKHFSIIRQIHIVIIAF